MNAAQNFPQGILWHSLESARTNDNENYSTKNGLISFRCNVQLKKRRLWMWRKNRKLFKLFRFVYAVSQLVYHFHCNVFIDEVIYCLIWYIFRVPWISNMEKSKSVPTQKSTHLIHKNGMANEVANVSIQARIMIERRNKTSYFMVWHSVSAEQTLLCHRFVINIYLRFKRQVKLVKSFFLLLQIVSTRRTKRHNEIW